MIMLSVKTSNGSVTILMSYTISNEHRRAEMI